MSDSYSINVTPPSEYNINLVGEQGVPGPTGSNGLTAYQVALANGFVGTESQWLLSLRGQQGPAGPNYISSSTATNLNGLLIGDGSNVEATNIKTVGGQNLIGSGDIPVNQANGLCGLDGTGKVAASQLPSYVDDVLEFANLAAFPASGTTGIIYVDVATTKVYRWSGSAYVELSPSTGIWGSISGQLSNQSDLQAALNAKAPLVSPSFTTPSLGTPAQGVLSNCTGYPVNALTGWDQIAAVTTEPVNANILWCDNGFLRISKGLVPITVPNLMLWFNADRLVASDSAGTTQATNGQAFKYITEISGNNRPASTSGTAPGTLELVSSRKVLRFSGTQTGLTIAGSGSINLRDFTAFYVISTPITGIKTLLSYGASNELWQYTAGRWLTNRNGAGSQQKSLYAGVGAQTLAVMTVVSSGTTIKMRINGFEVSNASPFPASTVSGTGVLGSLASGQYPFNGDMRHKLQYARALTPSEVTTIENYLMSDIGVTAVPNPAKLLVWDGNSVIYGTGTSDDRSFAGITSELLDSSWTPVNFGVPGATTPQIRAYTDTYYSPSRTKNANVLYEARNQIGSGAISSVVISAMQSKGQAAVTTGWNPVVICDCPTQSDFDTAKEAVRVAFNNQLYADFTVPTGNANVFGARAGVTYGHYLAKISSVWTDNTIHPGDTVAAAVAAVVKEAIVPTAFSSPLLTGLLGYFNMEEASGTRANSTGGSGLTQAGTVGRVTGKLGFGASFNGVNANRLESTLSVISGNNPFTIAFWFNGSNGMILAQYNGPQGFDVFYNGTTLRFFSYHDSNNVTSNFSQATKHVVVSWSGTVKKLFVDGALAAQSTPGTNFVNPGSNNLVVGNRNGNDNPYTGWIDGLGVWSRALSDSEVTSLYNSGNGLDYPF